MVPVVRAHLGALRPAHQHRRGCSAHGAAADPRGALRQRGCLARQRRRRLHCQPRESNPAVCLQLVQEPSSDRILEAFVASSSCCQCFADGWCGWLAAGGRGAELQLLVRLDHRPHPPPILRLGVTTPRGASRRGPPRNRGALRHQVTFDPPSTSSPPVDTGPLEVLLSGGCGQAAGAAAGPHRAGPAGCCAALHHRHAPGLGPPGRRRAGLVSATLLSSAETSSFEALSNKRLSGCSSQPRLWLPAMP